MISALRTLIPAACLLILPACSSIYYDTMERFGVEKREILVDRVEDAREAQGEAQEEFKSGLEEVRSVVSFDGGELETRYNRLSKAYDRMEGEADSVRSRISDIERVANALFREWESELDQYSDGNLRAQSAQQLTATRLRYGEVIAAMNRAAERMDPVLEIYSDQVLFLKHNLNARAISTLETERVEIEARVEALLREMDAAIIEANAFISEMGV